MNSAEEATDSGRLETAYLEVTDTTAPDNGSLSNALTRKLLSQGTAAQGSTGDSYPVKIQFNPATLSFSASTVDRQEKRADISSTEQGEVQTALADCPDAAIDVSFRLVYDRTIYEDASVQPDVENFIALVTNPYVRQVAFYWGKLVYQGVIKSVSAEYALFNARGMPTRAYIDLTIQGN